MTDGLELIEAAYDLELSEADTLKLLATIAARAFRKARAVGVFEWGISGGFLRPAIVERGDERIFRSVETMGEATPQAVREVATFSPPVFFHAPRWWTTLMVSLREAHSQRFLHLTYLKGLQSYGALLGTTGYQRALAIGIYHDDIDHWSSARHEYLTSVAAHLGAAWRLRLRLASAQATIVGEFAPDGRSRHLDAEATSRGAREVLRTAIHQRELARSRRRSGQTASLWPAIIAGRWSLVDAFSAGGRRHVIAYRNPVPTHDKLRSPSLQELAVLEYALRGRAGKWIALELGLSEATVTRHLQRALLRIGASGLRMAVEAKHARFRCLDYSMKVAEVPSAADLIAKIAHLSPTERTVLTAVQEGYSTKEIARARGSSSRTVDHQIAGIYRKLGVSSRRELVTITSEKCLSNG